MLSFSPKELRKFAQAEEAAAAAAAESAGYTKTETHTCQIPTNYAGDETGTISTCACGQRYRMKSGFLFSKWERI